MSCKKMILSLALAAAAMADSTRRGLVRQDFEAWMTSNSAEGAPGVKVQIELDRAGEKRMANANETFYEGDVVRFLVTTNFDARLEVTNEENNATPLLLFPKTGETNHVDAGKEYRTPAFVFDNKAGVEKVRLILSDRAVPGAVNITSDSAAEKKVDIAAVTPGEWEKQGAEIVEQAAERAELKGRGLHRVEVEKATFVMEEKKVEVFQEPTAVTLALRHGTK